jgi:magnesium chelatase subunit ChlI-like protein
MLTCTLAWIPARADILATSNANAAAVRCRSSAIVNGSLDRSSIGLIFISKCRQWNTAMFRANARKKIRPRFASELLGIARARQKQHERFARDAKTNCNARMTTRHLKTHCKLNADSQELIRIAMRELNLRARAYDRILKVSRTIADLDDRIDITPEHISEAIQYRTFDRTL